MPRKLKQKIDPALIPSTDLPPMPEAPVPTPEEPKTPEHNIFNTDGELVVDVFETHHDFVVLSLIHI
jgi:hypothetical protein